MIKKIIYILFCALLVSSCSSISFSKKTKKYKPAVPVYKDIKIAFVLGAGGAKGLAHVGAIEELLKHNIKPDLIVGCSAGSIVGSIYADTLDIQNVKAKLIDGTSKQFLNFSLSTFPISLYSSRNLHKFLQNNISAKNIQDLKIPFAAIATNLQFGDLTVFSSGPLIPAIKASSAYPGAFYPVKIQNQYFVDGGVADPIPVQIAKQMGAEFIIAIDISGSLNDLEPKHMMGLVKRSLEISYINQSIMARHGADVLIKVPFKNVGTFSDGLNSFIYQEGKDAASKKIHEIQKLLDKPPRDKIHDII